MMARLSGIMLVVLAGESSVIAQDASCIDDPHGIVASTGNTCASIVSFGCDYDLNALYNDIEEGTIISSVCTSSCEACGLSSSGESCSTQDATRRVDEVMRACCPGGHRRAQDGDVPTCDLPEACPSTECAVAFITLMTDCQLWMGQQAWPAEQVTSYSTGSLMFIMPNRF